MKKISYAVIIFFIIIINVSFSHANIPDNVLNQRKAVVTIYVNDKDGQRIGTGTGFVIDSDGVIATNYHVMSMYLEADNHLLIKMENGAFFPLSELVNYDKENDVAVFKVEGKGLPKVKIANNYNPKQGESIVVVGSPLGLETTVSDGIVSSIRGKEGIIQITAPISPGSSGSPVFNLRGEVIGVATFLIKGGQSLNFAVPIKYVENLLKGNKKPNKKRIVSPEVHSSEAPKVEEDLSQVRLKKNEWVRIIKVTEDVATSNLVKGKRFLGVDIEFLKYCKATQAKNYDDRMRNARTDEEYGRIWSESLMDDYRFRCDYRTTIFATFYNANGVEIETIDQIPLPNTDKLGKYKMEILPGEKCFVWFYFPDGAETWTVWVPK